MKHKSKIFKFLIFFALTCASLLFCVFTAKCEKNFLNAGDLFSVKYKLSCKDPFIKKLKENYKMEISFDSEKIKYDRFGYSGCLRKKDIKVKQSQGMLTVFYNPRADRNGGVNKFNTELFEFIFSIKDASPSCQTSIDAKIFDPVSCSEKSLGSKTISIEENPQIHECKLNNIILHNGDMSPNFSPEIFNYSATVSCDTEELNIETIPFKNYLKVSQIHKKLNSPGKYTTVNVKVSDEKLKINSIYTIKVYREKPSSCSCELKSSVTLKCKENDTLKQDNKHSGKLKNNSEDSLKSSCAKTIKKLHKAKSLKPKSKSYSSKPKEIASSEENQSLNVSDSVTEVIPDSQDSEKMKKYGFWASAGIIICAVLYFAIKNLKLKNKNDNKNIESDNNP